MQGLKDILSVLAPMAVTLLTTYLSDKRVTRRDDHSFLKDDYEMVVKENKELRKENERLRKELSEDEAKHKNH